MGGEEDEKAEHGTVVGNLMEMSEAEKAGLREQVARTGGAIQILVHPFYYWEPGQKDYRENLEKIFSYVYDKSWPVVVMEEYGNVREFVEQLKERVPPGSPGVYIVPTIEAYPEPAIIGVDDAATKWSRLMEVLKEAGVTRVLIGGQRLKIAPEGVGEDLHQEVLQNQLAERGLNKQHWKIGGCVGTVATKLADAGIQVDISNLAKPFSRRNIV
jgi:hypothetical protein